MKAKLCLKFRNNDKKNGYIGANFTTVNNCAYKCTKKWLFITSKLFTLETFKIKRTTVIRGDVLFGKV